MVDGQGESEENCVPLCNHKQPAKLVMVKKEGKNKVLFAACLFKILVIYSHDAWIIFSEQLQDGPVYFTII